MDQEKRYKFDLETPFERTFLILAVLMALLTFATVFAAFFPGRDGSPPKPHLLPLVLVSLPLAILAGVLRKVTDCYYLVDPKTRRIDSVSNVSSLQHVTTYLKGDDVALVAVECYRPRYGTDSPLEDLSYGVVIVDRSGKRTVMSDSKEGQEGRESAIAIGKLLSEVLASPFEAGNVGMALLVEVNQGKFVYDFVPVSDSRVDQGGPLSSFVLCFFIFLIVAAVGIGLYSLL